MNSKPEEIKYNILEKLNRVERPNWMNPAELGTSPHAIMKIDKCTTKFQEDGWYWELKHPQGLDETVRVNIPARLSEDKGLEFEEINANPGFYGIKYKGRYGKGNPHNFEYVLMQNTEKDFV